MLLFEGRDMTLEFGDVDFLVATNLFIAPLAQLLRPRSDGLVHLTDPIARFLRVAAYS